MDLQLAGKAVLITGASGGIGRELARVFAAEGCKLVLTGHSNMDGLTGWLKDQPFRAQSVAVKADVAKLEDMRAAFGAGSKAFGRVDICVANAGKWPPPHARLDLMTPERMNDTLQANLMGAIWTAKAFMESLARSGPRADGHGASLVFIGSTAGRFGEPGHADYSVAKAGLYGLVRTLKNDITQLDPYGRVNMVEPGWTITEMAREALDQPGAVGRVVRTMPIRQLGRAVDVARTVATLSSPAVSRHTSGEVVTVAGGMEGRVIWDGPDIDETSIRERTREES